jgi:peptidoglycan/LPS O-acetylase OafA/YrhL
MKSKADIPALTGIRGIAAWWIVLFHFQEYLAPYGIGVRLIKQGYLAVDVFFELSGFIIALNYANQFRALKLRDSFKFLGVRLARIYPLHLFVLALFLLNPLAIALFSSHPLPSVYGLGYFVMSLFLVQNWGFASSLAWNVPAWSISTEWLAYLFFPGAIWLAVRLAPSRWRAVLIIGILLCVLAGVFAAMGATLGDAIPQTGAFRCLIEFWLGMCLYLFWARGPAARWQANLAGAVAIGLFVIYSLGVPDFTVVPLAFLLLIFALTNERSFLSPLMMSRPVMFLGVVSYSTYMAHFFIKDWVKFMLVRDNVPPLIPILAYFAITAAASVLLYRLVEVPGRKLVRNWTMRLADRQPKVLLTNAPADGPLAAERVRN